MFDWLRRFTPFRRARRRNVIFLHNSYYHFFHLARALRKRGWDALVVSVEDPRGPNAPYYHGEDINLYSADAQRYLSNITDFFYRAKKRFDFMHFAGDGHISFFPSNAGMQDPPDILEWRALGKGIAYTSSGCNSGTAQSSVTLWSSRTGAVTVCDKCVWQSRPEVCNDEKNLAWGKLVDKHCDLIFSETIPALDYMANSEKVVREPMTTALDPEIWNPGLAIPSRYRLERLPGELLVYHAVGNFDTRSKGGRNIKGTPAVVAAIDRLKREGFPVRLIFITGMSNLEIRYIQAQADVIVDQLNYGRYGATAREGMMLGKPVVCYINPRELNHESELQCLRELPLVSATEATIYEVLKELLSNADKRRAIGATSRAYALKWHSADACAERYERLYDQFWQRKKKNG